MVEMDMKEKLVDLAKPVLTSLPFPWCTVWRDVAKKIADAWLANGVTVQKHGRWENIRFLTTGDGRMRVGDCSSCKSIERVTRYCPNCGAKMDEKGEAE